MKSNCFSKSLVIPSISLLMLSAATAAPGSAKSEGARNMPVARHQAVFTTPPARLPSVGPSDAPLLGNGDFMAAIGGRADALRFYLCKADLWELKPDAGPRALGALDVSLEGMQGADYKVTQDLLHGTTAGEFRKDGITLRLETAVAATENLMWVKLSSEGGTLRGRAGLASLDEAPVPAAIADNDGPVHIGREMYGNGRFAFDGEIADITIRKEPVAVAPGESPAKPAVLNDKVAMPRMDRSVSVGAWIKINKTGEANYILCKGEWNRAYSLGLVAGRLRWSVNGTLIQSTQPLETGKWIHVSATFDGKAMRLFIDGKPDASLGGDTEARLLVERRYEEGKNGVRRTTGAACALRMPAGSDGAFTVEPGKPVTLVLAASGLANTPDYREDAVRRADAATPEHLAALEKSHDAWWADFWSRSSVEIADKSLEKHYYLSHYAMACASRLSHFPPGLYGWTLTRGTPEWGGAYFLNYNFFAPFYGLYAANHIEQAMPCNDAVLDALELGRDCARDESKYEAMCGNSLKLKNVPGILLPTSLLPYGVPGAPTTWGQRSNASYACVPLASTWYATQDIAFAKRAYPFVREVATFWEHFLVLENGRYVDRNDAVHENSGRDVNPIHTLALIRQVMNLALDFSSVLGEDAGRQAKWRDIRDRLSDYPQCTLGDLPKGSVTALPDTPENRALPIFRLSEQGYAWHNSGNTVVIQHIFPGNGIGLGVRPELLERARNTIRASGRWIDMNGCNSFYPAAVRVGHDPEDILKHLRHWSDTCWPNGMRADNPHGIEMFSVVPSTLQEMMLQSYDGTLRFFPNWPGTRDARFTTLRARGAFLVSAELKGGQIGGVRIVSEKGKELTVQNPWPGKSVTVLRNGKPAETVSGERFTLKSATGEHLTLEPR